MNENSLIIAAAGSGKTTHLANEALARDESILILTYTLSNEDVIKKRLFQKSGCIPPNVTVQTWFSFLLQHGVRPYQGCLDDSLYEQEIKGMILVNKQSGLRFNGKKGPVYWGEKDFNKHYFTNDHKIYSDKISKFICKLNEESNGAVIRRLSCIYEHIFIDEVQDLAGHDLELLKLLFASTISILLVGDPRQVTYLTHPERKYAKYKNGNIREFVESELGKHITCEIDETTLGKSHRCCQTICEYSSRLYPNFPEAMSCSCCGESKIDHQGVFLIEKKQLHKYVKIFSVMQLRWDRKTNVLPSIRVMNFGEAKGETFDRVLIYPTEDMATWIKDNSAKLTDGARAKFYVALTRARYSVAIVMDDEDDTDYAGVKKWGTKETQ